jgi:(1->4)-alpha-D-glucan 1-alpha-D-glucosylmutase
LGKEVAVKTPSRTPLSTYRVQFNCDFGFDDARRLVPYLKLLGITDLYASPLTQARPRSTHGYDVTDPTRLNSELGTERAFQELAAELKSKGMGLLLDIVPNHMAVSSANPWWMDVLEKGPESSFARCFDIGWNGPKKALQNKIMLPILALPYGRTLENQEFTLSFEEGGFWVNYHGTRLPLILESYVPILNRCVQQLRNKLGPRDLRERQVEDVLDTLKQQIGERIASSETTPWKTPGTHAVRPFDSEDAESQTSLPDSLSRYIKERLWQLGESEEVRRCVDDSLCDFQGQKEDSTSFDLLDGILEKQFYWLAFWRLSDEEINYRRFFAINDLIGVRVDDPAVFALTHALVLRLVKEGSVTGLRIDHIDGLLDPLGYLQQLREQVSHELGLEEESRGHIYTVVEKILTVEERLPDEWPVEGTTGYDFLNLVNAVFVDPFGAQGLREVYHRFIDSTSPFEDILYQQKMLVMRTLFAGEIRSLGMELDRLAEQDRYARDLPLIELTDALMEVTAYLTTYRTYIRSLQVSATDRRRVDHAVDEATHRNPAISPGAFDLLRQVLLLDARPHLSEQQLEARLRFVMRWQQFTGPIMAKGFEDTALYVYNPLVSLNEVGGRLRPPDSPVDEFHGQMQERLKNWPYTLNATSTHDTKRSDDVRARIDVLSEMPAEWEKRLRLWSRWNEEKRTGREKHVPDPSEEVLLYQTMLGAWPFDLGAVPSFRARLQAYMVKAAREAKVHTQWAQPDTERESRLKQFIDAILVPSSRNRFLRDFLRFQKRIAHLGAINSLSQTLLKICAPGVPDFYQGSELWDLRLVDPDNRGAVDFRERGELIRQLKAKESERLSGLVPELLRTWQSGSVKLYVTAKALGFRRNHGAVFLEGDYLPLRATGTLKEHVCAFARSHEGEWVMVIVPRIVAGLVAFGEFPVGHSVWGRSVISLPTSAPGEWRNVLTGESLGTLRAVRGRALLLGDVFRSFPVALLTGDSSN